MACVDPFEENCENLKKALCIAFNEPNAEQYWCMKFQNLDNNLATLDTQAMEQAMSESMSAQCRWVSKQITSQFAHGKNMV